MGVRFPSVFSNTLVNANVGINVETVVVTTPPLTLPLDGATVLLHWYCVFNAGASSTFYIPRIRRGTTTGGTQVSVGNTGTSVTPGNGFSSSGCYFDTPGAVAGQQYSLTLILASSTAVSPIADAVLLAFVL